MENVFGASTVTMDVRRRVSGDVLLLVLSVGPAVGAFWADISGVSDDLFVRSGAIMVLFAAFLEFRTHEVQLMRARDHFHALWRATGILVEGLAQVDRLAKYLAREISALVQAAGMQPNLGDPEQIKDMVVTEGIQSLRSLPKVPESFYSYTSTVASIGKVLVVLGTLIWAFGDKVISHVT